MVRRKPFAGRQIPLAASACAAILAAVVEPAAAGTPPRL
jgi:hypothetical protein